MIKFSSSNPLIYTVKDKCRVCYTCVRGCPAKALKISGGQAEVITERCIACGNCIKVCSQEAKAYKKSIEEVKKLINSENKTVACIAPSFPAEFTEFEDYKDFVGKLKGLGFDFVHEVAFGADIAAIKYRNLSGNSEKTIITSDCPAVVLYITHYHKELITYLAPIVSPMVASARIIKERYGDDIKIVFIGPCIAKKTESEEVDAVLTFSELREMLVNSDQKECTPIEFDMPVASLGAIFPVSKGLMQTVGLEDSILEGKVITAEGNEQFREAIDEFEKGNLNIRHLELLSCEGCISGPAISKSINKILRRTRISEYVRNKNKTIDIARWHEEINKYSRLDYSTSFSSADRRKDSPLEEEVNKILKDIGKLEPKDHLDCGACGYSTCRKHAIAIIDGLAEDEMCLPYTIEKLHNSIEELNISNENLASARQALIQSEKLAGMGQLSAGIAHELNNPLGVITMYSNILKDEIDENNPIREDLELIVEQAERCKKIVGGLLNFARKSQINPKETNITQFVRKSLNSIIIPKEVSVVFNSNIETQIIDIDTDQIMQVLTNLEKNAIEAMPKGGVIKIRVRDSGDDVVLSITDSGTGISEENMGKIFTPFFTTKEPGKGTGLGLPLIYGIIKMHNGKIEVVSNTDNNIGKTGTTFKITLPKKLCLD